MNGRFVVRPQARRDIRDIADYIAADNLEASDRFIDEATAHSSCLPKCR
jgi:plasmid stabilization system protein ParE